ncbi:hypothetical protein [Sandaracinus amylolyticus]|uniref:Uncharacterized protein n=1 Tax=Sandaracinus amylolyticus TaxID=927083 RepID=A0A0F6W005_9BACT|nr:hypothetical protein [Sandaracinus amylolyticus]AKF03765.1 hypothetical protein DB32_000914 [Sandaracinus amylolyticus]
MKRGSTILLVAATVLAAPIALAFESVLRWLLFPPDFEAVRAFLEPFLTPLAWLLVVISALAGIAGTFAQRTIAARRIAKLGAGATAVQIETVRNQVFLITASIPQLPTIASTFAFMFGASLVPTLVGVAIGTLSVLAQGVVLMRGDAS